jgi:hypothetical protein
MEGLTEDILVTDGVCQISALNYDRVYQWVTIMKFVSLHLHESFQR